MEIEAEHNSFEQSDDESETSYLTTSIARVNSLNQLLEVVCTELNCINKNMSAQCDNPVHNTQTFAPQAYSTPAIGQQDNNIMLNHSGVGNEPSSSAYAPRSMLVQSNDQDQYRKILLKIL